MEPENFFLTLDAWAEARLVPAEMLVLTDWNCNEMSDSAFATLVDQIEENGFDEPCQVVPIVEGDDAGKYLVTGGEHRYKACIALEESHVPCVLKPLDPTDREGLMEYSVLRNNLRGRLNAQKYAEIEAAICRKRDVLSEVARERMLVRGEQLKALRKTSAVRENESRSAGAPSSVASGPATDSAADDQKTRRERASLLAGLRALETEVLMQSGDTVDHGYLYFGRSGKTHLVVDESKELYSAVSDLVALCKNESGRINDLLVSAIRNELARG